MVDVFVFSVTRVTNVSAVGHDDRLALQVVHDVSFCILTVGVFRILVNAFVFISEERTDGSTCDDTLGIFAIVERVFFRRLIFGQFNDGVDVAVHVPVHGEVPILCLQYVVVDAELPSFVSQTTRVKPVQSYHTT